MAYQSVDQRPGVGVGEQALAEQRKVGAESQEGLLETREKQQVSPEKRFAELKTRLQELNATLVGSDQMIESMRGDLKKMQELNENASEEAIQLTEYCTEIDQAKAEQKVLQARLDGLLDDLGSAHAKAITEGDQGAADGLEKQMAEHYALMDVVPVNSPEARAMGESVINAERAAHETRVAQQAGDAAVQVKDARVGGEVSQAQGAAETVVVEAAQEGVRDDAELGTAEAEAKRAEFSAATPEERKNIFDRLVLQSKWSQEAAGGAVTPQAEDLQKELYLLAQMIRTDVKQSARPESEKAPLLKEWDLKVQSLSHKPEAIDVRNGSGNDRFFEEMSYTTSLAASAREEIDGAHGTVTEKAKALLQEAIALQRKQLGLIREGKSGLQNPDEREKEWATSIEELQQLLGERGGDHQAEIPPHTATPEATVEDHTEGGEVGIDAAEEMPEILKESRTLVSGEQIASVQKSVKALQEVFESNRSYSGSLTVFSQDLEGLTKLSQGIDQSLDEMDQAFQANPPDQAAFDELIRSVGEQMKGLRRRATVLEEEFSALGSGMKNTVSNNAEILGANDEEEVVRLTREAQSDLEEISKALSRKHVRWQVLEDHLARSGR